jgi:GTP pyrophosphokinase
MKQCHAGQYRKQRKYSLQKEAYIAHPLTMACQAHAMGIRDDALLAAVLLHDTVEDTDAALQDLPFSEEVREIVDCLTYRHEGKKPYYERIAGNPKACLAKMLDRCNNLSTMSSSFSRQRMIEYIRETEKYILPLADLLKENAPEFADAAFLLKYQILSVTESIKYLI